MSDPKWDLVIDADDRKGRANLKTIWKYRDLLFLFVRRDFVAFYKQTVLGPLLFFIKPMVSTAIYFFIFGKLAGLSTGGVPPVIFYLSGITAWTYFVETVTRSAEVLRENQAIFGKVYFPRLIMPLSIIFSNMIKLGIQLLLLILIFIYYLVTSDLVSLTPAILLLPLVILIIAMQSVGIGLFVSGVAIKYRDVSMLLGYAIQLGFFISPVVYPLSTLSGKLELLVSANPMSYPIELFRYCFTGIGSFPVLGILYMVSITLILFILGIILFNKSEKTFVDTV